MQYINNNNKIIAHRLIQVNEILFSFADVAALYGPSRNVENQEEKQRMRVELANGPLKTWFSRFDAQIAGNPSGYLVGDSVTVADLLLWSVSRSLKAGEHLITNLIRIILFILIISCG